MSTFSLLIASSWVFVLPSTSISYRHASLLYRTFYYLSVLPPFGGRSKITASVSFLVSCISGAGFLLLYVVTRFFTDGCFQAHRQVVIANPLPFALRMNFETLSFDLGCFPLNVQYLSTAVGLHRFFPSLFPVYTRSVHFDMPSLAQSFTPLWLFRWALLQQLS